MRTFIEFIYTVLIGAAIVLFVGLGIWTFYSGPKAPSYPDYPSSLSAPSDEQNKIYDQKQAKFQSDTKKYEEANKKYGKKVSAIGLVSAVIAFVCGLVLMRKGSIISEGISLGGVFTAGYAAVWGGISSVKGLVFASVTVILAMLIVLVQYKSKYHKG